MPYIITKTNGAIVATIDDASLDTTTDLQLVGRNYAGYGQVVNQNFVKLLENFASSEAPKNSIPGQIWYNNSTKSLNVFDGSGYKGIASLYIQDTDPVTTVVGDLWWDTANDQLKGFTGSRFRVIGPPQSAQEKAYWTFEDLVPSYDPNVKVTVLKGLVTTDPVALLSSETFTPADPTFTDLYPVVRKGLTLSGADAVTGKSAEGFGTDDYMLWGTAAHALRADTATSAQTLSPTVSNSAAGEWYVPFVSTSSGSSTLGIDVSFRYSPSTDTLTAGVFSGVATSSRYADLAERYEADQRYDVGTVVVIGGPKEVIETHTRADTAVAGVISKNPGYMLNAEAGTDDTHPYVALRGRVPCKVIGPIKKGDLLVTSSYPGHAEVFRTGDSHSAVIGKSLVDFNGPKGMIEILV